MVLRAVKRRPQSSKYNMSILFNEKEKIFHIQTQNSSYIFCISNYDILEHLYYGKKIPDDNVKYISNRQVYSFNAHENGDRAFSVATVGLEISPFNSGDFRVPSVVYHYENNLDCNRLRYRSHIIYKGRKAMQGLPYSREDEETETLEILLTDDEKLLAFTLYYTVYADVDVIARYQTIKNNGGSSLAIQKFSSMCLDFYGSDFDVITLEGMYLYERAQALRAPLKKGIFTNKSVVGISSHHKNPFIAICKHNADEDSGEAYGFNLVYSGNFSEEIEVDRLGNTRILAGIDDTGLYWELKQGESFSSPEAIMTYSMQGLGGMSRNFHDHIRNSIIEKEFAFVPRPIVINSWEASYFTVTEEKVLALASSAKDCGIDTVVLDDGWFRDGIERGLGDWHTDKQKFPSGLKGLSEKIHAMGLKFGLWLEPEMVNPESNFYKENPDCILSTSKAPLISRTQYVLDLTKGEIIEKIANRIAEELRDVKIEYIKWDFNRYMTEAASYKTAQGEIYHRQTLGAYKLLAILKERLGNVFFETCSGGGGRFDLGMLFYSPQIWTSDNTDPYARAFIQYGTSYAYPVSAMSCHFTEGVCTSGRESSYDFRYKVATFGSYGYELDLSKYGQADKETFKEYSKQYRKDEELNLTGDLYRLISPESNSFCAYMKVLKDKSRAQLTFLELNATGFVESTVLKLKGLAPDKLYRNGLTGEILHGETLMSVGIRIGDLFREKRENGYVVLFREYNDKE